MNRNVSIWLLFLCISASIASAGVVRIVSNTTSADGGVAIARADVGRGVYFFLDVKSGKKLGYLLPPDQMKELSNVSLEVSWNSDNSAVAVKIDYGVRLGFVNVYARNSSGTFDLVRYEEPDPTLFYKSGLQKLGPRESLICASENHIGYWTGNDVINLIVGDEVLVVGDRALTSDQEFYLLVSFALKIDGKSARVLDLKYHEVDQEGYRRIKLRPGERT